MTLPRRRLLAACLATAMAGCVAEVREVRERLTGEWSRKRALVETYDRGLGTYNEGVQTLEVAVSYEAWEDKAERIPPSLEAFSSATECFGDAEEAAASLGEDGARRICATALDRSRAMRGAAEVALEAAELFAAGEPTRGDASWQEFRRLRDRAQEIDMYSTRELARVLGLAE